MPYGKLLSDRGPGWAGLGWTSLAKVTILRSTVAKAVCDVER